LNILKLLTNTYNKQLLYFFLLKKISKEKKTKKHLNFIEFKSFLKQFLQKKKLFANAKILKNVEDTPLQNIRQKDVVVHKLVFKVTRNNIFVTVTNPVYGHVYYSSGGLKYFFLRKQSVAVANVLLGENLGAELRSKFVTVLDIEFVGLPLKSHKLNFIKGLKTANLLIRSITDKTPLAYNGCYRKKKRRKKLRHR
jgi:small subunit ribosomal protein S11